MRVILLLTIVCGGLLALTVWRATAGSPEVPAVETASPKTPEDARQQELLEQNIDRPGDPVLDREYQIVNAKHFAGALPSIPIRWEPALDEVGALANGQFSLEGMVGRVGERMVMLLNPKLKQDRAAFDRALSHEMTHVYLYTQGDTTSHHGPAFKAVLRRLSEEGAFSGIAGSDAEKTALRSWLDAESARIDAEEHELEEVGARITAERASLEAEMASARGAAQGPDATSTSDAAQDFEARRNQFNQLVLETNTRLERGREALAHFNAEVARYNLMMAYPDGMDEDAVVPAKPARR